MQPFTLEYVLRDHGWATARVFDNDECADMSASYLHDSLDDLATAAIRIQRGDPDASVLFMDEPGEHKLKLAQANGLDYRYQVQWFDDWNSLGCREAGSGPKLVIEGAVSARRFVQQVHTALYRVLRDYGVDGYKSRWAMHDFALLKFEQIDSQP